MTGDIVRAITLTTYGNSFLRGSQDISMLKMEHPSFVFTNKVEFNYYKKPFWGKAGWYLYEPAPIDWIQRLKKENCREIRMLFQPDNSVRLGGEPVPDHMLAGFVGGGGRRLLETVFDGYSDFWQSKEEVTDRNNPDNRVWSVGYGRILSHNQSTEPVNYDIDEIKERLGATLDSILSFTKEQDISFWSDHFEKSLRLLNTKTPETQGQHATMVPIEKMKPEAIQLLSGAGSAWCFGGMGSWNDLGFEEGSITEKYHQLTSSLYRVVNESYLAVANNGLKN